MIITIIYSCFHISIFHNWSFTLEARNSILTKQTMKFLTWLLPLTCGKELLHVKGRTTLLPKIIKSKKTLSVIIKMFALKVRNSPYQANLNILLSSLAGNATRNDINGFYNASTGHGVYEVYGLFLCRGDVSVEVCRECVNLARNEVVQRCPIQKEAIIWYDKCFLRYSNSNIFSSLSQTPAVYMFNTQNNCWCRTQPATGEYYIWCC